MVVLRSLRVTLAVLIVVVTPALALASSDQGGHAIELTLADAFPAWLPGHLEIESLQASFPCQGGQCHFQGQFRFDRGAGVAKVQVNATLSRGNSTLSIQGDVRLGSGGSEQTVTGGELQITGIRPWLPATLAEPFRQMIPNEATLGFSPAGVPEPGQWPMGVSLTTEGGASPAFEGEVVLHTGEPWRLEVPRGRLTARLARLQTAGWLLNQPRVDLPLSGTVTADRTRFTLEQGANARVRLADALAAGPLMWANGLMLQAGGMVLSYQHGTLRVEGPASLSADKLRYPGLVTQAWQADARLSLQGALDAEGELSNAAGATLPFRVRYGDTGALNAELSMDLTKANDANHLADTLSAWPAGLTLEKGEINVTAEVYQSPNGEPEISGGVSFGQASGLYQAMAWEQLSGQVSADWRNGDLSVDTEALELAQLNPGIPIGPIFLTARYQAPGTSPAQGNLMVEHVSAGFSGGTLSVADATGWDLSEPPWAVPVDIDGVKLSTLMNLYPTEGLSGEGTLKGHLPVVIGLRGVRIENGRIEALPPGGRLQLPADRLGGMAQANAAMALVAKAMDNFHFRLLESGINYGEDGTLLLDLQLRGSSPEVDSDRPVVLNINLQEDIPALLTSLQLSGRVNDAVRERVRERLLQDKAGSE